MLESKLISCRGSRCELQGEEKFWIAHDEFGGLTGSRNLLPVDVFSTKFD